jgi:hypothetical protein
LPRAAPPNFLRDTKDHADRLKALELRVPPARMRRWWVDVPAAVLAAGPTGFQQVYATPADFIVPGGAGIIDVAWTLSFPYSGGTGLWQTAISFLNNAGSAGVGARGDGSAYPQTTNTWAAAQYMNAPQVRWTDVPTADGEAGVRLFFYVAGPANINTILSQAVITFTPS